MFYIKKEKDRETSAYKQELFDDNLSDCTGGLISHLAGGMGDLPSATKLWATKSRASHNRRGLLAASATSVGDRVVRQGTRDATSLC